MFSRPVVVALDTGQNVIYAPATGWRQLDLLWTFRNFRSLPYKILNQRQQELMGLLYREARNHAWPDLTDAAVVGTIESFRPSTLSATAVSAPHQPPFYARFVWNRTALKAATGTLAAVITVLTWYQLKAQPVAHAASERASAQRPVAASPRDEPSPLATNAIAKDPVPAAIESASNPVVPLPPPVASAAVGPTPAPFPTGLTTAVAPKILAKTPSTLKGESRDLVAKAHTPNSAPATVHQVSADQPRIRISGRPQKLVYPVCPETHARGKVSLQAVVDYDGAVSRVRVLTGDRVLAAAAIEAVRQWRYQPFSGSAAQLERETNITVSFISSEVVAVSFPDPAPLSR
jgi:periplasmic protein TonB